MTPEAGDYPIKGHRCLANARRIVAAELPDVAAREAYLASYHAAEAYIFERTGKAAKTHRGVRSQFNRLAQHEKDLIVFGLSQKLHDICAIIVFPAKAGIQIKHGHRPSPV